MRIKQGTLRRAVSVEPLISDDFLSPRVTYTRSGIATGSSVSGLTEVAANDERFDLNTRLIWEGQRTNLVTNPRAENFAAGTPGTQPTGWGGDVVGRTINGVNNFGAVPLLDLTYTVAGVGNKQLRFELAVVAAAPGEIWTASCYVALISGTGVSAQIDLEFRDSVGLLLAVIAGTIVSAVDGVVRRTFASGTAPALTARITAQIRFEYSGATTSQAYYGGAQVEIGAFATSLILPLVGVPAASTRGADTGIFTVGSTGTIVFTAVPGQVAPSNGEQNFVTVSDGTDPNRLNLANSLGSNNIQLRSVNGGVISNSTLIAVQVPGTLLRGVLTWSGTTASAKIQGGTWRTLSNTVGGYTSGRIGNLVSGLRPLSGTIGYMQDYAFAVDEAAADALMAGIP